MSDRPEVDILARLQAEEGSTSNGQPPSDDEPSQLLAGLRTGDWLDAQVFPPLSYVVPGLIPRD